MNLDANVLQFPGRKFLKCSTPNSPPTGTINRRQLAIIDV